MLSGEISLESIPATQAGVPLRLGRPAIIAAIIAMILGLLTAASIVLVIYEENRAFHYAIEASESWSAYQVKIVQTTVEEDPNLKEQYTDEQDLLRRHAQELRQTSGNARHAVVLSTIAVLLLLFGAASAVIAIVANSPYAGYVGVLAGVIGVGLGIRALF